MRDVFTEVLGERRGSPHLDAAERERTDLDRVRELVPLIAAVSSGEQFCVSTIALRRRARALGVEVLHGLFGTSAESEVEAELTLVYWLDARLLGVVEADARGVSSVLTRAGV